MVVYRKNVEGVQIYLAEVGFEQMDRWRAKGVVVVDTFFDICDTDKKNTNIAGPHLCNIPVIYQFGVSGILTA